MVQRVHLKGRAELCAVYKKLILDAKRQIGQKCEVENICLERVTKRNLSDYWYPAWQTLR